MFENWNSDSEIFMEMNLKRCSGRSFDAFQEKRDIIFITNRRMNIRCRNNLQIYVFAFEPHGMTDQYIVFLVCYIIVI